MHARTCEGISAAERRGKGVPLRRRLRVRRPADRFRIALCMMARWKSPPLAGETRWRPTLSPPADVPAMVTFPGSPPIGRCCPEPRRVQPAGRAGRSCQTRHRLDPPPRAHCGLGSRRDPSGSWAPRRSLRFPRPASGPCGKQSWPKHRRTRRV